MYIPVPSSITKIERQCTVSSGKSIAYQKFLGLWSRAFICILSIKYIFPQENDDDNFFIQKDETVKDGALSE